MKIIFHMGAHSTDEDRLIRVLAENQRVLDRFKVAVPAPQKYRMVLRDALVALRGGPAPQQVQDAILLASSDQTGIERVIFSHEFFLCVPERIITPQGFYSMVPGKLDPLANLFPEDETEFHMALINPATLIPLLKARLPNHSYEQIMMGQDPRSLRWEPVVRAMAEAAKGRKLVIWCNEDVPLIWPEVLRRISGVPEEQGLNGDMAILDQIMLPEGTTRLRAYLKAHPAKSVVQRRKIVAAFLDKYVKPEEIELDATMPGWDESLVAEITALYDADAAAIAQIPGVEFLAP